VSSFRILFIGDIVGRAGRKALKEKLPELRQRYHPQFIIANGENAAGGVGITPGIAGEIFSMGVDGITLGNHAFDKREIMPYLDEGKPLIRPHNLPKGLPGRGAMQLTREGIELVVINLCGRLFMSLYDDPFAAADELLSQYEDRPVLIDFHAEATSEKLAFGYFVDGRASAVVGTHTHVQTADQQILPKGTAYLTDVGMSGPSDSVIGIRPDICVQRFTTSISERYEPPNTPGVICGVAIDVRKEDRMAKRIERFQFGPNFEFSSEARER
jgi:metallophosphoesterase (TIGR00282 family)